MDGGTGPELGTRAIVQHYVDELLSGSSALQALPDDRRQAIVRTTAKVAQFIVGPGGASEAPGTVAAGLVHAVDFPEFVRGLIDGVFHAIVDSSVEQMQAYGDLVKGVADRIHVAEQACAAGEVELPGREEVAGAMLVGINRITGTEVGGHSHPERRFRPWEP